MAIPIGTTGRVGHMWIRRTRYDLRVTPREQFGRHDARMFAPNPSRGWHCKLPLATPTERDLILAEYNSAKGSAGEVTFTPPESSTPIAVRFVSGSLQWSQRSTREINIEFDVVQDKAFVTAVDLDEDAEMIELVVGDGVSHGRFDSPDMKAIRDWVLTQPNVSTRGFTLRFGDGTYNTAVPFEWNFPNVPVKFIAGPGARFTCSSPTPLAGSTVLGFRVIAGDFTWEGPVAGGYVGIASTPDDYAGINILANNVNLDNLVNCQESSITNIQAATGSLYDGLLLRNCLTFCGIEVGTNYLTQPDPALCRKISCVRIGDKVVSRGEPLPEAKSSNGYGSDDGRFIPFRIRGSGSVRLGSAAYGDFYGRARAIKFAIRFATNPTNTSGFGITDGVNPRTTFEGRTSGPPADDPTNNVYYFLLDAGTKEASMAAASAKVESVRAAGKLSLVPNGTLPFRPFAGALNIMECTGLTDAPSKAPTDKFGGDSATSIDVTKIYETMNRKTGVGKYALILHDCMGKQIDPQIVGPDKYKSVFLEASTGPHNNFTKNEWSEGGHLNLSGMVAHSVTYTDSFWKSLPAPFASINLGQGGQMGQGVPGTKSSGYKTQKGLHRSFVYRVPSGDLANGDKITIFDGKNAHTLFDFTAKTSPANILEFQRGVSAQATANAIKSGLDFLTALRVVNQFCTVTAGPASSWDVQITYFTFDEWETEPGLTEVGAGTVFNVSTPYRSATLKISGHGHWFGTFDGYSQNVLWIEDVYQNVQFDGFTIEHQRTCDPSFCGQAFDNFVSADDGSGTFVPANGSQIKIENPPGTTKTYEFRTSAPPADADPLYYVNITGMTGAGARDLIWPAFKAKVESVTANDVFVHYVKSCIFNPLSTTPYAAGFVLPTIYVVAKSVGVSDAGGGVPKILNTVDLGTACTKSDPLIFPRRSIGAASMTEQFERSPVVIKNCGPVTVNGMVITPFSAHQYVSGSFLEVWGNSFDAIEGGLVGADIKPFYITSSSASTSRKVKFLGCNFEGNWGQKETSSSKKRLYNLSGSIADADITAIATTVGGVAVS